ncbi:carboxymuconolactone decarboxylase family protein [Thiovibrio sp. JS02]
MAHISTVPRDQAEGIIREGYEMFLQRVGAIPKPLEMLSVSPRLFELQLRRIQYLAQHPRLSFSLLAHIRYLVAHHLAYPFCTDFNEQILRKQGVEEADFRRMEQDPSQSLLEENESAMLVFVVKSVTKPSSVTAADIEGLRALGWQDRDMVDALAQGVSMIDHAIMMQVFGMDQECLRG